MDAVSFGALLLGVIQLVLAILDDRRATRPQRVRAQQEQEYDRDIVDNAHAAATGDETALTRAFDAERQAAIRRGDLDPRSDTDKLHQLP